MSEFRAAARQQTLRTGIIEFATSRGSTVTIPCTIRDVSATGARLQLNSSLWIPKQITLIFSGGLRKDCKVAWRKGRLIGAAFAGGAASPEEQAVMMTEEEQSLHRRQIGARVRRAREMRGYTDAELAERIGVAATFMAQAEQGEADIPLYKLMHIADLLLISLDRLVAGEALCDAAGEVDAA